MNNSCTTDFYDECMKDDYPYKVAFSCNCFVPTLIPEYHYFTSELQREPEETTRFDLLYISPQKIKTEGLTVERIQKQFNKMKDEIENKNDFDWKDVEQPKWEWHTDEDIRKLLEKDLEETIKKSAEEFVKKTKINDRFEILDL